MSAVVTIVECPSIACTVFRSTPAAKLVESNDPTLLNTSVGDELRPVFSDPDDPFLRTRLEPFDATGWVGIR
jgi:hypothetical protein